MNPVVVYYRVSTKRQGQSGLGLEGQRAAVEQHLKAFGGIIRGEYQEIESGRRDSREELAKAISHAKRSRAILLVAKLDRLARDVAFTSALMKSGVDFVCCDNPTANKLTIHILAAVAEEEADQISNRTKAALAAYKARGGKLGGARPGAKPLSPDAWAKGQQLGAAATKQLARGAYSDILPIMLALRDRGESLAYIAEHLNILGHSTRTDKRWSPTQVKRVLDRVAVLAG